MDNEKDILSGLFISAFGYTPTLIEALAASGSNRRYFRLWNADGKTCIGVVGDSVLENDAFIALSAHFTSKSLPVPKVIAVTDDRHAYLQEDLGAVALFDLVSADNALGGISDATKTILEKTMCALADLQFRGAEGLDFSVCFPVESFDRCSVMWDLNYFKYCFLKLAGIDPDEPTLEKEFERLADSLLAGDENLFMYRDFQSRNVMVKDGAPWFIDFQGGRRGPAEYDVASFLWQARAKYPAELREHLIDVYLNQAAKYRQVSAAKFRKRLDLFVMFRLLQVLGAYGFRGIHERKTHFLRSIVPALESLLPIVEGKDDYPELRRVITAAASRFCKKVEMPRESNLVVTVSSFSYKKGIPEDKSGNGGGFVFDCRGMHNPGRYDEYKKLTGRDEPVIRFLEERGEVQHFLDACYSLVDHSVETYLRRGFTSLTVSFGCTGGQHRSVYCAEHMAAHLQELYPAANVVLIHREHP